jgi:Flp pilus assembly pilin Flp
MMGIQQCRTFQRDTSGATAIEFAFLVGPLLLLFIGTIEVGRLMWSGHALDEVAISAARCMGIRATGCAEDDQVVPERTNAFIISAAQSWGLVLKPADISLNSASGCAGDTGFLRVALSFSFVSVLPGLDGATLQAEACFPNQL